MLQKTEVEEVLLFKAKEASLLTTKVLTTKKVLSKEVSKEATLILH